MGGKFKIKSQTVLVAGESLVPDSQRVFSLFSRGGGGEGILWVLFDKITHHIQECLAVSKRSDKLL